MPDQSEPSAEERAENLKERIYVTFTASSTLLARASSTVSRLPIPSDMGGFLDRRAAPL
ncbi:MAG TPA: hypothetical protein VNT24_07615 [Propionibacteriaceae bacterium]|nr:hypothetical protein [Propionibacteriaceae bacterium]